MYFTYTTSNFNFNSFEIVCLNAFFLKSFIKLLWFEIPHQKNHPCVASKCSQISSPVHPQCIMLNALYAALHITLQNCFIYIISRIMEVNLVGEFTSSGGLWPSLTSTAPIPASLCKRPGSTAARSYTEKYSKMVLLIALLIIWSKTNNLIHNLCL